ncbi:hypothetical protein [Pseudomonas sp. GOM6]|uniref:hypothetical protein n=1 Tax=Pseudomonas sp. GOM6 TaxID=3036944 RepID=UPI00240A8CD8|nr:hypothetical protein [Pseudomonas sp. GOM6]MDG1580882.1 hypothetical protein [Pseudomonas sp. GOM6]
MTTTKKIVFEANVISDFLVGPTCGIFDDAGELLNQVQRLNKLVLENGLTEARISLSPEWLPSSAMEDISLAICELVVTGRSFWFVDLPSEGGDSIETYSLDISSFVRLMESDAEILFATDSPRPNESLKETYLEAISKEEDAVEGEDGEEDC